MREDSFSNPGEEYNVLYFSIVILFGFLIHLFGFYFQSSSPQETGYTVLPVGKTVLFPLGP